MVSIRCLIGTAKDAVEFGDVVLLAVPFSATEDVDPAPSAGKILLDADNCYPGRDGLIDALEDGSTTTSEITQSHFADARVVKASSAILERDIETTGAPAGTPARRRRSCSRPAPSSCPTSCSCPWSCRPPATPSAS